MCCSLCSVVASAYLTCFAIVDPATVNSVACITPAPYHNPDVHTDHTRCKTAAALASVLCESHHAHLQVDVGGGHQLEEQVLPGQEVLQQAKAEFPTVATHGRPAPPGVSLQPVGQKRKRVTAQSEQDSSDRDPDSASEEEDESADEADTVKPLDHLLPAAQIQNAFDLKHKAGKAQPAQGTQLDRDAVNSIDSAENKDSDSDDSDDLMVVKRRDVLSGSNAAAKDSPEGIPLGAVELRGNKKKKKLRIDPGRTSGARTVFDEEGESLQPLALLAKEQLDR